MPGLQKRATLVDTLLRKPETPDESEIVEAQKPPDAQPSQGPKFGRQWTVYGNSGQFAGKMQHEPVKNDALKQPLIGSNFKTRSKSMWGKVRTARKVTSFYTGTVHKDDAEADDFEKFHSEVLNREADCDMVEAAPKEEAKEFPPNGRGGSATRHVPTPKVPDPMPPDVKFMFRMYTNEEIDFVWRIFTCLFVWQLLWCWAYCFALRYPDVISFGMASWIYAVVQVYTCIQNIYLLHDVLHVAPFPPKWWQQYITHPFADLLNCGWQDIILEHKRHHFSSPDLLEHGEFGWDPSLVQYYFMDLSWFTVPLAFVVQLCGFYDTGMMFMWMWFWNFPNEESIEPILRPRSPNDRKAVVQRRIQCGVIQLCQWAVLIGVGTAIAGGTAALETDLKWHIFLVVLAANRVGWAISWTFFANINHSHWWNEMLAEGADRHHPFTDMVLTAVLGGRARMNEMKFHDLHHAFPNKIGAMSMRGRFYDWDLVHDAALYCIQNGIFEEPAAPAGDTKAKDSTKLNKLQKRRTENFAKAAEEGKLLDGRAARVSLAATKMPAV